jgi:CTP-dependent riboflavin kinase
MRNDFTVGKHERPDGQVHHEDLLFDYCRLLIRGNVIDALIMRPIDHADPHPLIEIMSERKLRDAFGLQDGDPIEVGVRIG